jgi:DNA-binding LacI/PurR family transcriptional regulator
MKKSASPHPHETRPTNLKMLAAYLNLSPSTISYVLNDSPGRSIPTATRDRVKAAAAKFNYRPSMIARTLQGKRMQTIGVLLPELGEGYHSQVLSGVGDLLIREGYFYFTVHHRHKKDLIETYPDLLRSRGVDGILAIDTLAGTQRSKKLAGETTPDLIRVEPELIVRESTAPARSHPAKKTPKTT